MTAVKTDIGAQTRAEQVTHSPTADIPFSNVWDAIKYVKDTLTTALAAHLSDTTDAHAASAISFAPVGTIAGTDVQTAIAEVATDAVQALSDHIGDTSDAHDASAISIVDLGGNYTATDVEAALAEVMDALQTHEADSSDAHDASAISIVDAGTYFTGTDVEAALQEAGADIAAIATGYVAKSLFDAHTILAATSDDTPVALTVGEQSIVGRKTAGNIAALSASDVRGIINVEDGATADMTASEILSALLTVDGSGSGLDADLLDGNSSAAFATAGHNHDSVYQPLDELLTEIANLSTDPNADSGLFFDDSTGLMAYWTPTGALSFSNTNLVVASASTSAVGVVELATDAEVYSNSGPALTASHLASGLTAVSITNQTPATWNWTDGIYFTLTISQATQIANPSGTEVPGQTRMIYVVGNDGTDRTITFGNQYFDVPTITDCDSGQPYLLIITCMAADKFTIVARKAW